MTKKHLFQAIYSNHMQTISVSEKMKKLQLIQVLRFNVEAEN